ncbi:polysaccharide biosynthesis/export family protein [Brevundimonas subvibrioides]|uniref:polysaccharide biosynthesis/export family protein n=1 Tax=Brevundimonas subvibrioides TaxID=74313 RepID=UPI0022B44948|nr:polysaccharide biosynthesis/export family protein [Brevundimonas subvibrioides]
MKRSVLAVLILATLGGCSTVPRDGPSGRAIERGAEAGANGASYAIVPLDYAVAERIKATAAPYGGSLAAAASTRPIDVIGEGDQLIVSVFEPGGALFGGGSSSTNVRSGGQALPAATVDRAGAVSVPYAGSVHVAGLTTTEAAAAIRRALVGKVGNPQVSVALAENASNTVTVLGEVRSPGRKPLSVNSNTILDVIAAAGGSARPTQDVRVDVRRGDQTYSAPLTSVSSEFAENIRLQAGDLVSLSYVPRRYSTFGALGAITQVDMPAGETTLAGALSRVGGLNDGAANARSVMVFRFERPEVAQALGITQPATIRGVPVIYRLNLEEGEGLFTAGSFLIQPEDIIYAPRALSAEVSKFFGLIQQVTRVVYDLSVTSTLTNN